MFRTLPTAEDSLAAIFARSRLQQIRDGDGGNNEDEGDRDQAQVSQDQAGNGQPSALQSARAFADLRKRNVAENDGYYTKRK
jgi:hypothetical protein